MGARVKGGGTSTVVDIDGRKMSVPKVGAGKASDDLVGRGLAPDEAPVGPRTAQTTIPGTEPKLPPGIARQAQKVLDLRDAAELAKQRADKALEFLQAAMHREALPRFDYKDPTHGVYVTFRVDQPEPKVKIDHYKRPSIAGSDIGEAVG